MCGIALIINKDKNLDTNIKKIISKIKHRGPDDEGFLLENDLALGSNRLSILDLSNNGHMPFKDKSGRYNISFNGEIYNYIELKEKFKIQTKTGTDTEVLIELYSKFKEEMLSYLNGIFSFIIYDNEDKKIFCARDRLGVKPLYYYHTKDKFIVSSEIKGILSIQNDLNKINRSSLVNYLNTSFYDMDKNTFFENIYQLQPSNYLLYDLKSNQSKISKYWNINEKNKKNENETSLMNELNELIINSFRIQMRTDTDLGVNISSGIDSKLMLLTLDKLNKGQNKIRACSYYFNEDEFDEKYDLEEFSKKIGWSVNFYKITPNDIIENFENVFNIQDEPFPGVPTIAKDLLIKKGYNKNFKVILEGQGGDDFAAGYLYVFPFFIKYLLENFQYHKVFNEIKNFMGKENFSFLNFIRFYFSCINSFKGKYISADGTSFYNKKIFNRSLLNEENVNYKNILYELKNIKSPLKKIIYRDLFHCKLPRILRSCDRASMNHSKELRVPLLDHNIVKFFYNLNETKLIKDGNLRYFYRKYLKIYYPLINESKIFTKKKYISDPQVKWLKSELYEWALEKLSSNHLKKAGIYNQKILIEKFKEFKNNNKMKNSNLFWQAICIEKLHRNLNSL
tara:strand:+ start:198 stop:2066 length:1869 start_codon:yes stop_codon:yes gene_type:complete